LQFAVYFTFSLNWHELNLHLTFYCSKEITNWFFSDRGLQHPVGHAVPLQELGPDWRSSSGPGRVPRRQPIPFSRSSESGREQTQGISSADRSHSSRLHVRHTSQIRVVAAPDFAGNKNYLETLFTNVIDIVKRRKDLNVEKVDLYLCLKIIGFKIYYLFETI